MQRFIYLFAAVVLACGVSCVSGAPSGYRVVVANKTLTGVRDVSVEFNGTGVWSVPSVVEGEYRTSPRMPVPHPPSARLRWTDAGGKTKTADIKAHNALPRSFAGKVVYEIQPDDTVRIFVEVAQSQAQSDLPWTRTENWEGVPGIPGLIAPE